MRGPKAQELKGIDDHDLKKLTRTKRSIRERRRYFAFAHIKEGKSFRKAAVAVMVSYRSSMNLESMELKV